MDKKDTPLYVVLVRARNQQAIYPHLHLLDLEDVHYMSFDLEKAKQSYANVKLDKGYYWDYVAKYLIQTKLDIDYTNVEGLINQQCLLKEFSDLYHYKDFDAEEMALFKQIVRKRGCEVKRRENGSQSDW